MVPRQWQRDALAIWLTGCRGVVSVVTGAGKTAFALFAYDALRHEIPDLRLIVVVPTLALVDQWVVVLSTDGGFDPAEVAVFSGESRPRKPARANVLVINTARAKAATFDDSIPSLLVVDECHRAGSPENARALEMPAVATLGLSATPVRQFDDGFDRYIAPALGPVIFEYDYAQARGDGVISPFALHNFRFDLTTAEVARYDRLTQRIARRLSVVGEDQEDLVVRRLQLERKHVSVTSPRRNAAAVAVAERFAKPMLVFHERIASAEVITRLLDKRGHRVGAYHSKLGPSIRRRNLELFRRGEIDILVTCRALDEGLNVPNANSAVVAASTRSTRQRIQRLGRVLRPAEGKRWADVATVFATEQERELLDVEADVLSDVAETKWYEIAV